MGSVGSWREGLGAPFAPFDWLAARRGPPTFEFEQSCEDIPSIRGSPGPRRRDRNLYTVCIVGQGHLHLNTIITNSFQADSCHYHMCLIATGPTWQWQSASIMQRDLSLIKRVKLVHLLLPWYYVILHILAVFLT